MNNNNTARIVDNTSRLADGWGVFVGNVSSPLARFPRCRIDLAVAMCEQIAATLPGSAVEVRAL